jgi:hypothetical protein
MWTTGSRLQHNNAPAHTVLSIGQFLAKLSIPTFSYLSYHLTSPIPALLFPKFKVTLKGRRFQKVEGVIINVTDVLKRYHKHPSNSAASKRERGFGSVALLHKGAILKGIIFSNF